MEAISINRVELTATKQADVRLVRTYEKFLGPTAEELARLVVTKLQDDVSLETQEPPDCFAGLLNRGSSEE